MTTVNTIYLSSPQNQTDWEHYYHLRWALLRKAWQQPPGSERDEHESNAFHMMATDSTDTIVGVGRIHKIDTAVAQIHFMAVKETCQRSGIGSKLLDALQKQALIWKVDAIILNARDSHLAFYVKHHYEVIEPGETLFDVVKHTRMHKLLRIQ